MDRNEPVNQNRTAIARLVRAYLNSICRMKTQCGYKGRVAAGADRPDATKEGTDRLTFPSTRARHVRMHATRRAGRHTRAGYRLAASAGKQRLHR